MSAALEHEHNRHRSSSREKRTVGRMAGALKKGVALVFLGVVVIGTGAGILQIYREQKQERQNLRAVVIRDQQLLVLKLQQQLEHQNLIPASFKSP